MDTIKRRNGRAAVVVIATALVGGILIGLIGGPAQSPAAEPPAAEQPAANPGPESAPPETTPPESPESPESPQAPAANPDQKDDGAAADAEPESPLDAEIRSLVKQLGDADHKAREAATRRLRDIGEPALPALRKAMEGGDPEVCTRADALIRRLTRPRVPPAAVPGPADGGPRLGGAVVTRSVSVSVLNGVRTRTVEVTEAGRTVRITEGPDGIDMAVTGAGEDGAEQTAEFKARTAEELKQDNPEAFELYERYNGNGKAPGGGRLRIRGPDGVDGDGEIEIRGGLQDLDGLRDDLLQRREGVLRELRARRGGGGVGVGPPVVVIPPVPVPQPQPGRLLLRPPPVARPPGDDLQALRERGRRQMADLRVPDEQRRRVLGQLDRMIEMQARAVAPLIDPFQPPPAAPDLENLDADVGRHMAEYNRLCDELRRRMTELKLPDPGDALPPPAASRLGIAAADDELGVAGGAAGVTVNRVLPGSRGEKIGLRAGDEIRTVNGKAVAGVHGLRRAVSEAAGPLVIEGTRAGQPLKLEEKP